MNNDKTYSAQLVAAAVAPLREGAEARAEEFACQEVGRAQVELEAAGHDLNVVAPYPKGGMPPVAYGAALRRYRLFHSITKWRAITYQLGEWDRGGRPCYADIDGARAMQYIREARHQAAKQYESFVVKLVAKVGDCVSASLVGTHVWSHSTLVVEKAGGVRESWRTRLVVNRSKLGKPFVQFPTRKLGAKG